MPIVSAVLHVVPGQMEALRTSLSADPRLTVGDPTDHRLPVVGDTPNRLEDKILWRELEHLDEVRFFELAFADFSDIHEQSNEH